MQVRETSRTSPLSPKNLITQTKTAEQVKKDFSDVVLPGQLHNQVGEGGGHCAAAAGAGFAVLVLGSVHSTWARLCHTSPTHLPRLHPVMVADSTATRSC